MTKAPTEKEAIVYDLEGMTAQQHFNMALEITKDLYGGEGDPKMTTMLVGLLTGSATLHANLATALWTKEMAQWVKGIDH